MSKKLFKNPFRREPPEPPEPCIERLWSVWDELIQHPISYEEFVKRYVGQRIPTNQMLYDHILICHVLQKELTALKQRIENEANQHE